MSSEMDLSLMVNTCAPFFSFSFWQTSMLTINIDNEQALVQGTIPDDTYCYFVELKGYADGMEYTSNSTLVERS